MIKNLIFISFFAIPALFISACNDDDSYSCAGLEVDKQYDDTICVMDCNIPVCGCDGKTYCNECFAGKAGVAIQYHFPCGQDRRR